LAELFGKPLVLGAGRVKGRNPHVETRADCESGSALTRRPRPRPSPSRSEDGNYQLARLRVWSYRAVSAARNHWLTTGSIQTAMTLLPPGFAELAQLLSRVIRYAPVTSTLIVSVWPGPRVGLIPFF
jgi:hypothetical protein